MNNEKKNWLSAHADTAAVMTAIVSFFLWMNSSINDVKESVHAIEKDMTMIKTVLIMKNIMPSDFCKEKENN